MVYYYSTILVYSTFLQQTPMYIPRNRTNLYKKVELKVHRKLLYRKTAVKLPPFKVEDVRLKNECLNCYKSL